MAKLVTKFKYLKPTDKRKAGGYARYIAKRDGVEKIDNSKQYAPSTKGQREIIEKLLKDFPDSKDSFEYKDYLELGTIASASEFISRTVEENAYEISGRKTYAQYIATRPRSEKFGTHGLFTDDGVEVQLTKLVEELDNYKGNIWTAIISLHREDAERLGFNTGTRWRDLLRSQIGVLSKSLNIPLENLRWYAAFHNETHHPHVHLFAFSNDPKEGYLTEKGVEKMRSSLVTDIFAQDLISVYEKQTEHRNMLRKDARKIVKEAVESINSGSYDNEIVQELLLELADRLSNTKGKKVYGYLKSDTKNLIDSVVEELSKDKRIQLLYDLWYEQRENVIKTYTDEIPERISLADNKEFKPIKNAVIQEVQNLIVQNNTTSDDTPVIVSAYDNNVFNTNTATDNSNYDAAYEMKKSNSVFACIKLFRYLSELINNKIRFDDEENQPRIESKERRKIEDKKQGLGLH